VSDESSEKYRIELVKYGKVNRLVVNWIKKKLFDYEKIYHD